MIEIGEMKRHNMTIQTEKGLLCLDRHPHANSIYPIEGDDFPARFTELEYRGCINTPDANPDGAYHGIPPEPGQYVVVRSFLRREVMISSRIIRTAKGAKK
jgi:hypothetical protein